MKAGGKKYGTMPPRGSRLSRPSKSYVGESWGSGNALLRLPEDCASIGAWSGSMRRPPSNVTGIAAWEDSTMPRVKQASKRNRTKQALPVLGVVGISLTLVGGASEGTARIAPSHEIILYEEEISDVSLSTFFLFDKENAETPGLREKFAQYGCRGCSGCRGCRAFGGCAARACGGCRGCRGGGCGSRMVRPGGACACGGGGCGSPQSGVARGCGGGGCGGGGCGGCGCGSVGSRLGGCGGCGCGVVYRAPIPRDPDAGNSEDPEDQARQKAKKKLAP